MFQTTSPTIAHRSSTKADNAICPRIIVSTVTWRLGYVFISEAAYFIVYMMDIYHFTNYIVKLVPGMTVMFYFFESCIC